MAYPELRELLTVFSNNVNDVGKGFREVCIELERKFEEHQQETERKFEELRVDLAKEKEHHETTRRLAAKYRTEKRVLKKALAYLSRPSSPGDYALRSQSRSSSRASERRTSGSGTSTKINSHSSLKPGRGLPKSRGKTGPRATCPECNQEMHQGSIRRHLQGYACPGRRRTMSSSRSEHEGGTRRSRSRSKLGKTNNSVRKEHSPNIEETEVTVDSYQPGEV